MKKLYFLGCAILLLTQGTKLFSIPPTAPAGKKWVKIENMSDEFNGTALNTSKWATQDPNWPGRKPAKFETSSVSVGDGNLRVTASKKTNPFDGWTHNGAMVRSIANHQYGYFETRMKANKTFMSSTFWLMTYGFSHTGCDNARYQELDIQETVGIGTNSQPWIDNFIRSINSNSHPDKTPPCPTPGIESRGNSASLSGPAYASYYTYGCWWKSASEFIIYVDGVEKYTINPSVDFNLPMYLRMVLETYDWNPVKNGSDGMNDTWANRTTYYDWTRSWKLVDCSGSDCGVSGNAPVGQTIWLKANANGKYVCSEQNLTNAPLEADRSAVGWWEKFDVIDAGNGLIALKATNGKYVSADKNINNTPLVANKTTIGAWEKFEWIDHGNGEISLKANGNGKYVCAENVGDRPLYSNRTAIGWWEKFTWGTTTKSAKAIAEKIESNLIVFPNPVKDELIVTLKSNKSLIRQVNLYNTSGIKILSQNVEPNMKTVLPVSHLAKGVYILQVSDGESIFKKKIAIQ